MDKVPLLNQIKIALEGLLNQMQQLEKEEYPLHQIDKDLMLERTRTLYEQMMALENTPREEKVPNPARKENIPVIKKIDETVVDSMIAKTTSGKSQVIPETEPEEAVPEHEKKPETEDIPVTGEKTEEPLTEMKPVEVKTKPAEKNMEKNVGSPKITLDLFSEASSETLGDMLTPSEKPVVADSLQMSSINDLREAIGINDKFLFINELFNGDMERYNKVIDELNGFSGLSGALTYLTELQVQYQWIENDPTYQKLNVLLVRKFA